MRSSNASSTGLSGMATGGGGTTVLVAGSVGLAVRVSARLEGSPGGTGSDTCVADWPLTYSHAATPVTAASKKKSV